MLFAIIFWVLLIAVFGRLIFFAFKLCWKVFKAVFLVILLPLALIAVFVRGFVYIAIAAVVVVGIISLIAVGK